MWVGPFCFVVAGLSSWYAFRGFQLRIQNGATGEGWGPTHEDPRIPKRELALINGLLYKIYVQRRFQGTSRAFKRQWCRAISMMRRGGLPSQFTDTHLTPGNILLVVQVVDTMFLGGVLHQACVLRGKPLTTAVVERSVHGDDWVAYFNDHNGVCVSRRKWDRQINPDYPMSCEGVVCQSKLEALAHTIAHELVHGLVLNVFPKIDKASKAYLPDHRHGPIFHYLNKRLFGHTSDSFHYIGSARLRQGDDLVMDDALCDDDDDDDEYCNEEVVDSLGDHWAPVV